MISPHLTNKNPFLRTGQPVIFHPPLLLHSIYTDTSWQNKNNAACYENTHQVTCSKITEFKHPFLSCFLYSIYIYSNIFGRK